MASVAHFLIVARSTEFAVLLAEQILTSMANTTAGLLRKVAASPGFDIIQYTQATLRLRTDQPKFSSLNHSDRERFVASLSEFVSIACIRYIGDEALDAAKIIPLAPVAAKAKQVVNQVQNELISWLHDPEQVVKFVRAPPKLYDYAVRYIFFMKSAEAYFGNSALSEKEQAQLFFVRNDTFTDEGIISRIVHMGVSEHPLPASDTIVVLLDIVKRSARLHLSGEQSLVVRTPQLMESVLKLSLYKPAGRLPEGYTIPNLAVTHLCVK